MEKRQKVAIVAGVGAAIAGLSGAVIPDQGTFAGLSTTAWHIVCVAIGIAIIAWALMLSAHDGHIAD